MFFKKIKTKNLTTVFRIQTPEKVVIQVHWWFNQDLCKNSKFIFQKKVALKVGFTNFNW